MRERSDLLKNTAQRSNQGSNLICSIHYRSGKTYTPHFPIVSHIRYMFINFWRLSLLCVQVRSFLFSCTNGIELLPSIAWSCLKSTTLYRNSQKTSTIILSRFKRFTSSKPSEFILHVLLPAKYLNGSNWYFFLEQTSSKILLRNDKTWSEEKKNF